MIQSKYDSSKYKAELQELSDLADNVREDAKTPVDTSLVDMWKQKYGKEDASELYEDLGFEPHIDTIHNLVTLPGKEAVPFVSEFIRDAIRLGLRKAPIYPNIIAGEEPISTLNVQMPYINMSDAAPKFVNEGETIEFGSLSYGSKEFKVRKMGRGISLTDEVKLYSSLKVVSTFLQDFGVKLGYGLDSMAISILLNGEQADGSASAPVIGVETVNTIAYRDLLKVWIRLSRMGKSANVILAGESKAIQLLDLPEFKTKRQGTTDATLTSKTPIPTDASMYIHGSIPNDQIIILDPRNAIMKFNAQPLKIEGERIPSKQVENTYASLTTGFATIFREGRIVIDSDLLFSAAGFPAYMNMDILEVTEIK
jgi:hypothetical protein